MNSREEKNRDLRPYPQGDLESPFLEDELFAKESEAEWKSHLAALEAESPFQRAFEEGRTILTEPEELEEELIEEEKGPEGDDSLVDEVEAQGEEVTTDLEENTEELYDEKEVSPEDATSLEEESLLPEEVLEEEEGAFEFEEEESANRFLEEEASDKEPLPVPPENPVPFATAPAIGSYWPVRTSVKDARLVSYMYQAPSGIVGRAGRMFLAGRKGKRNGKQALRWHVGVDLFAQAGDVVVACEDGQIGEFRFFYKASSGQRTYSLLIEHEHSKSVVNYGEVTGDSLDKNGLKVGMRVKAGQPIGFVSDTSMLHFETYIAGTRKTHRWWKDEKNPPPELLNPTKYLLFLREHGLSLSGEASTQPGSAVAKPKSGAAKPPTALVRFAQRVLNAAEGERLVVDGILGPRTHSALQRFRRKYNLGAGGVLDDKTQLALAQRALEEIAQQSMFEKGRRDVTTDQALSKFKTERGLGTEPTLDAATRAALADTLKRRAALPGTPPVESVVDWTQVHPNQRMRYVVELLVTQYQYPVNGAAGIVGNLWAESEVIPNRIQGSGTGTPMTAEDFNNTPRRFTPEEVMNRNPRNRQGPQLAGVGLAQWTLQSRREGLFAHTFQGQQLGAAILNIMDAQVDYLVTELRTLYRRVDNILRRANVSLEEASDEVVYNYEIPGSIFGQPGPDGRRRKLPRNDPAVIAVFARRRGFSQNALRAYTTQQ